MKREIKIRIESITYEVEASLFGMDEADVMELDESDIQAEIEPDKIEIKTFGVFGIDGDRAEISYEESEATGMEGSITSLSFDMREPGLVTMARTGIVSTVLVFERGKRHHCIYQTPYMPFEICVNTLDVRNRIAEAGTLELDYVIEIRGAKAERTKFMMKIMD